MRLELDVSGLQGAVADVDGLRRRSEDLRAPFAAIGRNILTAQRTQFRTGRGWRRLAAATRARKARKGQDPRRLVATGALEREATSASSLKFSRQELRYGVTQYYAKFQARYRRKPIVVRRVNRADWAQRLQEHITRGFG